MGQPLFIEPGYFAACIDAFKNRPKDQFTNRTSTHEGNSTPSFAEFTLLRVPGIKLFNTLDSKYRYFPQDVILKKCLQRTLFSISFGKLTYTSSPSQPPPYFFLCSPHVMGKHLIFFGSDPGVVHNLYKAQPVGWLELIANPIFSL